MAGSLEDGEVMYGLGQMFLVVCVLEVDFYSFQQCAMNVEFLKDGTNFWACVQNSYTGTIQMKPLLLDWWTKSCSVISEIKLFGGTFFSQYFYNNIYKN